MNYIVSVPLTRPPMPCDKLPISFSNSPVHRSQIYLLGFFLGNSITLPLPFSGLLLPVITQVG